MKTTKSIYRPNIKIPLAGFELVVEIICILVLVVLFAWIAKVYPDLPKEVVSHYNIVSEADAWSGKNSLFVLPIVALGVYLLITIISRFPHVFNYPVRITEDNAIFQYQLARNYITILKLTVLAIFAIISWNTVHLSFDKSKMVLPGTAFLVFLSLVLVLPFGYYFYLSRKNR